MISNENNLNNPLSQAFCQCSVMPSCFTHASLFSGIGGFDLAAQWMGWTNVFQCEIDNFCQKVLRYHFPHSELFTDIKTTDFKKYANTIDVISGGFPCQPFSVAGRRKGTEDNRFLWPEMLRAIREIKPSWVVAENVRGLLSQEKGLVFERVCADLENEGYQTQTFIIPACSVGAPHKRDRVWIIANRTDTRIETMQSGWENGILSQCTTSDTNGGECGKRRAESNIKNNNAPIGAKIFCEPRGFIGKQFTSNATSGRRFQNDENEQPREFKQNIPNWRNFPTQSPVCGGNDGLSSRLDGITFPRWRRESIKAYGNAIVPQIAFEIFSAIETVALHGA